MNDIFWLSDKDITILELYSLLTTLSGGIVRIYPDADVIQTWLGDAHIDFTLMELCEFKSEEDLRFINEHNIKTIVLISFNSMFRKTLNKYLSLLSTIDNGWFGSDDEGFEPCCKSSDFLTITKRDDV